MLLENTAIGFYVFQKQTGSIGYLKTYFAFSVILYEDIFLQYLPV